MNQRILYMLNYVGDGGSEKYVRDLITAFGVENCILVYSSDGPGLDSFKTLGVKIYQVKMSHPFDVASALEIKKIIKRENIDVVHAQFLRENYIGAMVKLFGAKIKLIWTYHVDVPMSKTVTTLNRFVTKMNDTVVAVSEFMKRSLENKGVSSSKIKKIYNGIDCPELSHAKHVESTPVISIIGRIREEKGHLFLLDALSVLSKQNPEIKWKCHIFGEGPDKVEVAKKVDNLKMNSKVLFKGFTTDKKELYHKSTIVVVPSRNEALSYVAIEAQAYKTPAIVSNVGGLPEVVVHGKTGFVVKYGNVEDLVQRLKELLTDYDLYAKLAHDGRVHFEKNFTMDKMVKETEEIYKRNEQY